MPKTAKSSDKSAKNKTAESLPAGDSAKAKTIVFIHGIGNKPPPEVLKLQWDKALMGFDLGERSRLAYWVNRELHGAPLGSELDKDEIAALEPKGRKGLSARSIEVEEDELSPAEQAVLSKIEAKMRAFEPATPAVSAYALPLPGFARGWITQAITAWFLKDVRDFFFDEQRRKVMRDSLISRLKTGGGPFVLVSHSQGTMIAYDVLCNWDGPPIDIRLWVTLGSPLGITEVQDQLKKLTRQKELATPAIVRRWENFAARGDVVALDKSLHNDYAANAHKVKAVDHLVVNPVRANAHSGIGYLSLREVREVVMDETITALFQQVSEFTVARNLVREMTSTDDDARHEVLIELQDQVPSRHLNILTDAPSDDEKLGFATLQESGDRVVNWIRREVHHTMTGKQGAPSPKDLAKLEAAIGLERLRAYVSAQLTRSEIERMSTSLRNAAVYRIFKNSVKSVHVRESCSTVQAKTAHLGYGARGQRITWALLDSGIDWGHPHFQLGDGAKAMRTERDWEENTLIERVYDCLQRDQSVDAGRGGLHQPIRVDRAKTPAGRDAEGWDSYGHGSHVAGIIAGGMKEHGISAIAPETRLWSYKVLDDDGSGGDVKILKALDHIFAVNENSSPLRIHGVNLSLGGPFEAEIFGCGDTPLCKALRRLWRQGVVVVVSAGNEGQINMMGVGPVNMALSIGDPANLDECVVVGSVHASKPNMYGVSYFSSRGPTADGRAKPDIVAPGEKILSCLAGGRGKHEDALYTRMSGTSMAAPHVSGVAACFLSARKEFIGHPDKVKARLMEHATDLARDRMHQGAGLVNLVKMLINS